MIYIDGTCIQHIRNRGTRQDNKTGVTGVFYEKKRRRYSAYISFMGVRCYLGYYDSCEDAARARKAGEEVLFIPFLARYDEWEKHDEAWKRENPFRCEAPDPGSVRRTVNSIISGVEAQTVS